MEYRISVLMGIYNCAQTLKEALDSLLAQTYQGFKVIMCDDGSSDNTYEVAKAYADKYENFILIKNKKNIKLAATLNRCLQYADTEYIARMDGDDLSKSLRFEKEIIFLDEHPEYALVSCSMSHFDEYGIWKKQGKVVEEPTKENLRTGPCHCHAPVMIRTKVLKEVGGYTAEPKTERLEDYYLWYKIYRAGYRGYNLQDSLYMMRDDKHAVARRKVKDRWRGFILSIEIRKGLGLKYPILSGSPELLKILVPSFITQYIRKHKV